MPQEAGEFTGQHVALCRVSASDGRKALVHLPTAHLRVHVRVASGYDKFVILRYMANIASRILRVQSPAHYSHDPSVVRVRAREAVVWSAQERSTRGVAHSVIIYQASNSLRQHNDLDDPENGCQHWVFDDMVLNCAAAAVGTIRLCQRQLHSLCHYIMSVCDKNGHGSCVFA